MLSRILNNKLLFLLLTYIISIGFTDVFNLPITGKKVQFSEFIFIILSTTFIQKILKDKSYLNWRLEYIDIGALGYIIVVLLSCFRATCMGAWFDFLGVIYLTSVYFVVKQIFSRRQKEAYGYFQYAFTWLGVLVAISGIVGWVLAQMNIPTTLAWPTTQYYPYLGYIGRANGFTYTPGMMVSILSISMVWYLIGKTKVNSYTIKDIFILGLLGLAILLSFSKSILILFLVLLFLAIRQAFFFFSYSIVKKITIGVIILLIVVLNFGTHFLVVNVSNLTKDPLFHGRFGAKEAIIQIDDKWEFLPTPYYELKKTAVYTGVKHFPFGVGAGCFRSYIKQLKKLEPGVYPKEFWAYDPHSTLFGSIGELGFLGFFALLFLIYTIIKKLRKASINSPNGYLVIALQTSLFYFFLESISTDIMNFRLFWILLGILGALED